LIFGLESFAIVASSIQLGGFFFLIFGNITYNEIIEIKLFGLDKKLEKNCKSVKDK